MIAQLKNVSCQKNYIMSIEFIKFLAVGFLGGILGGMGMGGGTILIPLLTIFMSVNQHVAQTVNLVAFIPMAIVVIIMHLKNKLIEKKGLLFVILPATFFAVLGSILSQKLDGNLLQKIFGGFLLAIAILQFFSQKIEQKLSKNNK